MDSSKAPPLWRQSPDIANMKAHFCFRQYEHMNAIHFMLDSQGICV